MRKLLLLICLLSTVFVISGESFEISTTEIVFNEVVVGQSTDGVFTLTNTSDEDLVLTIEERSDAITISSEEVVLTAGDDAEVTVTFTPDTNILYDATIFVVDSTNEQIAPIHVVAAGRFEEAVYNTTYNKYDSQLKSALQSIINGHNSIGYSDARIQIFGYIDNDNGQVRCVYTNDWYNCSPGGIPNWNNINTEHTWPQSQGATGDAKSDMYHLYPTNSQANSVRGHLPFGIVNNANWQEGGSKRGSNSSGTTVFEPRDDHKGNVARAMFYFSLRYNNPSNFLDSAGQQAVLRNWYYNDPVDAYDLYRANEIEDVQNKPNPFVEHPEFLDRIANITSNSSTPLNASIFVPVAQYDVNATQSETPTSFSIPVTNYGLTTLYISNITCTNAAFSNIAFPNSIAVGDFGYITIDYTPNGTEDSSGTLQIISNDPASSTYNVLLHGMLNATANSSDDVIAPQLMISNYPNPFNLSTNISVKSRANENVNIEIFNMKGQKVKSFNKIQTRSGLVNVEWNGRDNSGKELPSGIYFTRVNTNSGSKTKKVLLMK